MDPIVRSAWVACAGESRAAHAALDALIARYSEPHRHYHGLGHLERVVTDVMSACATVTVADPQAVVAAAFFHDAVYEPRSSTNETDSAALAQRVLAELGWPPERRADVARLVLATATHEVTDPASAVLLDADLAVLGADPATYDAYVGGVRAEYAFVDDAGWRTGRAHVLRSFLDRDRLFHTEPFVERSARARANLAAELATLGQ